MPQINRDLFSHDNYFFRLAANAGRNSNIVFIILILILAIFAFGFAISLVTPLFHRLLPITGEMTLLRMGLERLFQLIIPALSIVAVIWLWLYLYEGRGLGTLGFEKKHVLKSYGAGLGGGIGAFVLVFLLIVPFADISHRSYSDISSHGMVAALTSLLVLIGWLFQGAGEEILTRGWLLQAGGVRYGPVTGILLSSLLFSVMHIFNNGIEIIPLLNLSLVGFFLSLMALNRGSLWEVCGWHSGWNWVQGNGLGLEVSGTSIRGGIFYNFDLGGNELFTGGVFGPEGSIITTAVLLGLAVWELTKKKRPVSGNNRSLEGDSQL